MHLELYPLRVNFIIVQALFEGGVNLLSSTRAHSAGSIRGREKIEEIRYLALLWMHIRNQCDEPLIIYVLL